MLYKLLLKVFEVLSFLICRGLYQIFLFPLRIGSLSCCFVTLSAVAYKNLSQLQVVHTTVNRCFIFHPII